MRDMIVACLRPDPSLSFSHASSGLEAIEQLSLRGFDLIVLDLNMPDVGGIEVVEFVRSPGLAPGRSERRGKVCRAW
jgi:two-component system chemotaxis response regulator CheY